MSPERRFHHRDLAIERGLTAVVNRGRGLPVLDAMCRLFRSFRHVLGGAGLLEQGAVLQHSEVEVAELHPVGAAQQQLAQCAGMAGRFVSTETGGQVLRPVAALGQLALVDEVDAGLALFVDDFSDRLAQTVVVDVDSCPHIVRCRQCADVGGENPVRAASHVAPKLPVVVHRSRSGRNRVDGVADLVDRNRYVRRVGRRVGPR